MSDEDADVSAIEAWFVDRDFGLLLNDDEEEPLVWAHLTRLPGGEIIAPRYGRGSSRAEAARRAKQRFEEEQ